MAATRLIPMHTQKNCSIRKCLKDRTDYAKNDEKTNQGEFVSSYECDPKTVDKEFELSKSQYDLFSSSRKGDIIAYQIRQSFKPGEVTPEEANQVGYETAMRWTKGNHAFIVATHTITSGFIFATLDLISKNFSAPKSAPKPASVTT